MDHEQVHRHLYMAQSSIVKALKDLEAASVIIYKEKFHTNDRKTMEEWVSRTEDGITKLQYVLSLASKLRIDINQKTGCDGSCMKKDDIRAEHSWANSEHQAVLHISPGPKSMETMQGMAEWLDDISSRMKKDLT